MTEIRIVLNPQTRKVNISTNATNKEALDIVLQAARILAQPLVEQERPAIIPATALPKGL